MDHHRELLRALRQPSKALRRATHDVWRGFDAPHEAATTDGALPRCLNEVTALAISVHEQAIPAAGS